MEEKQLELKRLRKQLKLKIQENGKAEPIYKLKQRIRDLETELNSYGIHR